MLGWWVRGVSATSGRPRLYAPREKNEYCPPNRLHLNQEMQATQQSQNVNPSVSQNAPKGKGKAPSNRSVQQSNHPRRDNGNAQTQKPQRQFAKKPAADPTLTEAEITQIIQRTETIEAAIPALQHVGVPMMELVYYLKPLPLTGKFRHYEKYSENLLVGSTTNSGGLHALAEFLRANHPQIYVRWRAGLLAYTHNAPHILKALKGLDPEANSTPIVQTRTVSVPAPAQPQPGPIPDALNTPWYDPVFEAPATQAPAPAPTPQTSPANFWSATATKKEPIRQQVVTPATSWPAPMVTSSVLKPAPAVTSSVLRPAPRRTALDIMRDFSRSCDEDVLSRLLNECVSQFSLTVALRTAIEVGIFANEFQLSNLITAIVKQSFHVWVGGPREDVDFIVQMMLQAEHHGGMVEYMLKDNPARPAVLCLIAESVSRHGTDLLRDPECNTLITAAFDSVIYR